MEKTSLSKPHPNYLDRLHESGFIIPHYVGPCPMWNTKHLNLDSFFFFVVLFSFFDVKSPQFFNLNNEKQKRLETRLDIHMLKDIQQRSNDYASTVSTRQHGEFCTIFCYECLAQLRGQSIGFVTMVIAQSKQLDFFCFV